MARRPAPFCRIGADPAPPVTYGTGERVGWLDGCTGVRRGAGAQVRRRGQREGAEGRESAKGAEGGCKPASR